MRRGLMQRTGDWRDTFTIYVRRVDTPRGYYRELHVGLFWIAIAAAALARLWL